LTTTARNSPFTLSQPTAVGKTLELAIAYRSDNPQRGLYFVAPTEQQPDKPHQVWTQGEDEDSRYWFPCFDYPGQLSTSEIRVRVPKPYQALSNGELVETVKKAGDHKIFHWVQKQVHPTYLMTLAVGDFDEIRDEWDGIPVTYYVDKGRKADAQRTMGKTPEMIGFFSDRFGYRYAFPKYAQVCITDFTFGGMENTSCTLLTDRCLMDERPPWTTPTRNVGRPRAGPPVVWRPAGDQPLVPRLGKRGHGHLLRSAVDGPPIRC
jgi:aminopeptidase N